MIQRRTWKDHPVKTSEGKELPDHEGVMLPPQPIGSMPFRGMTYQFTGPNSDDIAEQAARWVIQNTVKDEVEQLTLTIETPRSPGHASYTGFVLTKVGLAVVVSESATKPKVYR